MSASNTPVIAKPNLHWRVVDIAVTAVIAVASGVVFWAAGLVSEPISSLFQAVPGLEASWYGIFYIAGPLAAVIVRKPGAALFAEFIGALVEMVIGSHWGGVGTLIPGLAQGFGAELAFLIFAYKAWNLATVTLAGALSGFAGAIASYFLYYTAMSPLSSFVIINVIANTISGAVIAGALMWVLFKALAATGALDSLAGGRAARSQA